MHPNKWIVFCLIKNNVCLRHATEGLFYGLHIQNMKRRKKKTSQIWQFLFDYGLMGH